MPRKQPAPPAPGKVCVAATAPGWSRAASWPGGKCGAARILFEQVREMKVAPARETGGNEPGLTPLGDLLLREVHLDDAFPLCLRLTGKSLQV